MNNFIFSIPTEIVFGRESEKKVGELAARYGRHALILYGSERIRHNGLFDSIADCLLQAGVSCLPYGGIDQNPSLSGVREAIRIVREHNIDLLIAVGGGSVIDTAKAVSLGSFYADDVWDLYEQKASADKVLPIGVVLTMAATASEANGVSVIWNKEKNIKCALNDLRVRPKFALMNPELTYSVPAYQTAAGSMDIFAHAFERYIVKDQQGTLRNHLCESIMKTVIEELPQVLQNPTDYVHRSELMWAATMAHSNMIGFDGDYACHALSHIFTEAFGLSHGGALAIIMPAWCRLMCKDYPEDLRMFCRNVWGTENIDEGIDRFCTFVEECGLPVSLQKAGITEADVDLLAGKAVRTEDSFIGLGFKKLYRTDVAELIKTCL